MHTLLSLLELLGGDVVNTCWWIELMQTVLAFPETFGRECVTGQSSTFLGTARKMATCLSACESVTPASSYQFDLIERGCSIKMLASD